MPAKRGWAEEKALFIQKYGDRFDYSLVTEDNYVNTSTPIPIICRKHGLISITPYLHLHGSGCPHCGHEQGGEKISGVKKPLKKLFGVGINDDTKIHAYNVEPVAYRKWRTMMARCYSKNYQKHQPTYIGCSVCEEWWVYSNFKKWHDENYIDGYELDKDLLFRGNKVYSPKTCCYIPKEINTLLLSCNSVRGNTPIGVHKKVGKRCVKYHAEMSNYVNGKRTSYLGSFDTPEEAFAVYKTAKEKRIKEVAQEYYSNGLIARNVYEALMKYKVKITD